MKWSKLKPSFTQTGKCENKPADSLVEKSSVNEEYIKVHRTESYTDMMKKVETHELRRKALDRLASSSSSNPLDIRLAEYLLQPRQETLINMIRTSNPHRRLLEDYFEASFEACKTCESLLCSVHQARTNYLIIKRVIKLAKSTPGSSYYKTDQCHDIYEELASFIMLENPLQRISPSQFRDIHDSHGSLLHRLTVKFKKDRRRAKFIRLCKKAAGFSLVVFYSGVVIAVLVLAAHSIVGVFAAPGLIACSFGLAKKRIDLVRRGFKTSLLERLVVQLEVAAKGVFILINDFDTMGQLVRRLQDEIEHTKAVADMCVRNGKSDVLMEVVREFRIHQTCFLEQLEELEEHIYLCFLTINRSRMLVMQEIMVLQQEDDQ